MSAYTAMLQEINDVQMAALAAIVPELPQLLDNLARSPLMPAPHNVSSMIIYEFLEEEERVTVIAASRDAVRQVHERHREAITAEASATAPQRQMASVVYPNEGFARQLALFALDPIHERRERRVAEVRAKQTEYNNKQEVAAAAMRANPPVYGQLLGGAFNARL